MLLRSFVILAKNEQAPPTPQEKPKEKTPVKAKTEMRDFPASEDSFMHIFPVKVDEQIKLKLEDPTIDADDIIDHLKIESMDMQAFLQSRTANLVLDSHISNVDLLGKILKEIRMQNSLFSKLIVSLNRKWK